MSRRQEVAATFGLAVIVGVALVAILSSDNVAAGFSALFGFGLLVVACVAAWTGARTFRQLREDSRSRTRPMMAAELRPAPYSRGTQVLVIRNYGPSVARDVAVTFDPELPHVPPKDEERSLVAALRDRYLEPIDVVVPGTELDNIWHLAEVDRETGKFVNKLRLPDPVRVTITYRSDDMEPDESPYSDPFDLRADVLLKRTYADSSSHPDNVLREAVEHLGRISSAADAVARSITGSDPQPPPPDIRETFPGLPNA